MICYHQDVWWDFNCQTKPSTNYQRRQHTPTDKRNNETVQFKIDTLQLLSDFLFFILISCLLFHLTLSLSFLFFCWTFFYHSSVNTNHPFLSLSSSFFPSDIYPRQSLLPLMWLIVPTQTLTFPLLKLIHSNFSCLVILTFVPLNSSFHRPSLQT